MLYSYRNAQQDRKRLDTNCSNRGWAGETFKVKSHTSGYELEMHTYNFELPRVTSIKACSFKYLQRQQHNRAI